MQIFSHYIVGKMINVHEVQSEKNTVSVFFVDISRCDG
ncbi:hypothetical protein SAMN05878295_108109 [Aeromonas hydrophila]|nr:hypothetical protein SAMN05880569_10922 [Aeromonas hydrophila]SIR36956.1 hypothetical protein SAMN05878295_108109 [Aeromonas hydrophila]